MQKLRWTVGPAIAMVIVALMACKKKEEETPPAATTTAAPEPPPATDAAAEATTASTDDVKRYGDKESAESGTVRVTFQHAKIYKEADDTTSHIATLSSGTLVNRKARYGNYMLIDYPSGVGELSPGWILAKYLSGTVLKIDPNEVLKQDAGAVQIVDAGQTTTVVDAGTTTVVDAGTTTVVDSGGTIALQDAGGRLKNRIKPADAGK
jgi:hypothetical protein